MKLRWKRKCFFFFFFLLGLGALLGGRRWHNVLFVLFLVGATCWSMQRKMSVWWDTNIFIVVVVAAAGSETVLLACFLFASYQRLCRVSFCFGFVLCDKSDHLPNKYILLVTFPKRILACLGNCKKLYLCTCLHRILQLHLKTFASCLGSSWTGSNARLIPGSGSSSISIRLMWSQLHTTA